MSNCTCDYHQEQNKTDYSHAHLIPSHSNEGQLGEEKEYPICDTDDSGLCISPENHPVSEEKKDWEAEIPTTEQIVRLSRIALLAEILAEVEKKSEGVPIDKVLDLQGQELVLYVTGRDDAFTKVAELIRKKMV